jgi:hypothetical protein
MTTMTPHPHAPSYHQEKFVLENKGYGRNMALTAPTVLSFYQITDPPEEFKKYYRGTIVPWLNAQHEEWLNRRNAEQSYDPGSPYAIGIYLMGNFLVVVSESANYKPWETIANLDQHVTKVNIERLEWSPPEASRNASYSKSA